MKHATVLRICILLAVHKYIEARDNEISCNVQPVREPPGNMNYSPSTDSKLLMYHSRIMKGVFISTDYDPEVSPKDSLTSVSYEIRNFKVEEMNELKKQLTVHLRVRGTWIDSRITANFSGTDNNIILLEKKFHPLLWTPYKNIFIDFMISRKNTYHDTNIRFFKMCPSESWVFGRYPPNTLILSAEIDQRVVISCSKSIEYMNFPYDSNQCKFVVRSEYANATLGFITQNAREKFFRPQELSGFRVLNSKIIQPTLESTRGNEFQYTRFGVEIRLERIFEIYIYEYYLPCLLIVLASNLSFIIPLSALPARVGLVVTLFLTLTNMFIYEKVYIMIDVCFSKEIATPK